jgi:hypothetical protein
MFVVQQSVPASHGAVRVPAERGGPCYIDAKLTNAITDLPLHTHHETSSPRLHTQLIPPDVVPPVHKQSDYSATPGYTDMAGADMKYSATPSAIIAQPRPPILVWSHDLADQSGERPISELVRREFELLRARIGDITVDDI